MKILLFGAGGLLGRHLRQEMLGHDLYAPTHAEADITDDMCIDRLFGQPWDAVINAAAVCDFDACENDPEGTAQVNLAAPLHLARRCADAGALFVQFSSDYVFGGDKDSPLTEDDVPAPLSAYGSQKAYLEKELSRRYPGALVLRLSWLYGTGGRTFMSLLPQLFSEKQSLRIASGKHGNCLYARDAAQWIHRLVQSGATGLFNLVNEGCTSWEEFSRTTLGRMGAMGFATTCVEIHEVPYAQMGPNWSKRPRRSCLDGSKLRTAFPPGPRRWEDALDDFLSEQKSFAAAAATVKTPQRQK